MWILSDNNWPTVTPNQRQGNLFCKIWGFFFFLSNPFFSRSNIQLSLNLLLDFKTKRNQQESFLNRDEVFTTKAQKTLPDTGTGTMYTHKHMLLRPRNPVFTCPFWWIAKPQAWLQIHSFTLAEVGVIIQPFPPINPNLAPRACHVLSLFTVLDLQIPGKPSLQSPLWAEDDWSSVTP